MLTRISYCSLSWILALNAFICSALLLQNSYAEFIKQLLIYQHEKFTQRKKIMDI